MHPSVFGGFDMESQRLQSLFFICEISESNLERDVVDSGSCGIRPAIAGTPCAVEEGENLGVTAVAVRDLEKCGVWKSGHQRQANDFLVELLHGIQIIDAERNLAESANCRAFLIRGQSWQMHLPTVRPEILSLW